ncbi:MAG: alanyl-tRNA editing protein [Candidatus Hodarchaeales archaeon]
MAKDLYLEDMNLKEFEAEVIKVNDGKFIVLDQTAFHPRSGGIAHDEGYITRMKDGERFKVVYTGKFKGETSHEVDKEGLEPGDKVKCVLDWDRRYKLMRYHTALHVLGGIFFNDLGAKITGNDATVEKGRIDFNMENFDRKVLEEHVEKANEIIQKDLPVEVYYMDRAEVDKDPYMMKLAMGIPKSIKNVRIVDIKNFDRMPDGGCHVSSLKEIGEIKIKKLDNKGKNNRRLYFIID